MTKIVNAVARLKDSTMSAALEAEAEIVRAEWGAEIVRYGQTACLTVDVKVHKRYISQYRVYVKIGSDDWKTEDCWLVSLDLEPFSGGTEVNAVAQYEFDTGIKAQNSSKTEIEIYANIWLTRPRTGKQLNEEALKQHYLSTGQLYHESRMPLIRSDFNALETWAAKAITCTLKKVVIVIDPGHGYQKKNKADKADTTNTGTQCREFQYYEQNADKKPDKTKIKKAKANDLPAYVLDDIDTWIIKLVNAPVDKEDQEWYYVIRVAVKLKEELEKDGTYNVIFTRDDIENQIEQILSPDVIANRRQIAIDNDADYFLSIHCDGRDDYKISGAFVIIPREVDTNSSGTDLKLSEQFGHDLLKHYNVINHDANPVQQLLEEKGVLRIDNPTPRRVIIELGRMTNPHDVIKLYEANAQNKIATQLKDGIICNITGRYGKE